MFFLVQHVYLRGVFEQGESNPQLPPALGEDTHAEMSISRSGFAAG